MAKMDEIVDARLATLENDEKSVKRQALMDMYVAGQGDSVPVEDTTPYDQAAMNAAVAAQKAADDEVLQAAKDEASAMIADLNLKLSQKDSDALEEAIADQLDALAQTLRDRTIKAAPAPVPSDAGSSSVVGQDAATVDGAAASADPGQNNPIAPPQA